MRINKLITVFLVLSLALFGLYCKKSEEPESAIPEKYIGTWKAALTIEGTLIEFAKADEPNVIYIDLRLLGGEITVTLNKDGSYSLSFKEPGAPENTDQGKVTIDEENNFIYMASNAGDEDDLAFFYEWVDDNTLQLVTQDEFDFTLQGNPPVPAIITIILKRSS